MKKALWTVLASLLLSTAACAPTEPLARAPATASPQWLRATRADPLRTHATSSLAMRSRDPVHAVALPRIDRLR
jgi:hypothetical protein